MRNAEWGVWNYKAKHTVHAAAQDHPELKAAIKAFGQAVQLPFRYYDSVLTNKGKFPMLRHTNKPALIFYE